MKDNPVRFLFAGDVMLGRLVNQVLEKERPEFPWGDTLPLFRSADWRMCNLECIISDRGQPWSLTPKVFHFRSDSKNAAVLETAGIQAVSVANNHVLDYEYEAMFDMLELFDAHGIGRAGAGGDLAEASRPFITGVRGLRVGLIAFTDNEPDWEATATRAGVWFVPIDLDDARAKLLLNSVRETAERVDFLIVSAHWGGNWNYAPPPNHFGFGRALIDAGADLVFGHSAHVFRGVEIHRGRPIIYSAGDFIDDYAVDEIERNDQSFLFMLEVGDGEIRGLKMYPTIIHRFAAKMARGSDQEEIRTKMERLCDEFGTDLSWRDEEECLEIPLGGPESNLGRKHVAEAHAEDLGAYVRTAG